MNKRDLAIKYAWSYLGRWYKWGGDDPSGFDCSGLVIELLKAVGILPRGGFDTTAAGLFQRFKRRERIIPDAGYLAFWKSPKGLIEHVEFCIDNRHTIGASGGCKKTETIADAIKHNAFIKIRPIREGAIFLDPFL